MVTSRLSVSALLLCLYCLTITNGDAQWKRVSGFTVGSIEFMASTRSPQNEFAICGGRLYQGYLTWTPVTNATFGNVVSIATDSLQPTNTIYAGTDFYGLFRSTDAGKSWTSLRYNLPSREVNALAVSGSNVIAGTGDSGTFYSSDRGETWTHADSGPTYPWSLTTIGSSVYACAETDVYRSSDQGKTWTRLSSGWATTTTWSVAENSKYMFVGTGSHGAFRSSDRGTSWEGIENGISDSTIFALCASGDTVFAGTSTGLYLSTNDGTTWSKSALPVFGTLVYAFDRSPSRLYAGASNGAYYSTDGGANWIGLTSGLSSPSLNVPSLVASGANLIAGAELGIYYSTNHGQAWTKSRGMDSSYVTAFLVNDTDVFAGTDSGGVYLSTDHGISWRQRSTGLPKDIWEYHHNHRHINALAMNQGVLYAGVGVQNAGEIDQDSLLFYSSDYGLTWNDLVFKWIPPSASYYNARQMITGIAASGQDIALVTLHDGRVVTVHSSDNGANWQAPLALQSYDIGNSQGSTYPFFIGKSLFSFGDRVLNNQISGVASGLQRSTDFGVSWTRAINTDIDSAAWITSFTAPYLFVGTFDGQVLLSTDSGASMRDISYGLPKGVLTSWVSAFAAGNGYAYVSIESQGIFARPLSELSGVTQNSVLRASSMDEVLIEPNPTNGQIIVRSKETVESISVIDAISRVVLQSNPEPRSPFTFNLSSLPAGVYMIRIVTCDGSLIRQIVRQ